MDKTEEEIKGLEAKQDAFRRRSYLLMLELIFIFGVPATLGLLLGRWLDDVFESGKTLTLITLAMTFVLSWVLVIIKYRRVSRDLREVNDRLKAAKHKE